MISPPESIYLQTCGTRQLPLEHLSICGASGGKSLPWKSILISAHLSALLSIWLRQRNVKRNWTKPSQPPNPFPSKACECKCWDIWPSPVVQSQSHPLQSVFLYSLRSVVENTSLNAELWPREKVHIRSRHCPERYWTHTTWISLWGDCLP